MLTVTINSEKNQAIGLDFLFLNNVFFVCVKKYSFDNMIICIFHRHQIGLISFNLYNPLRKIIYIICGVFRVSSDSEFIT